MGCAARLGVEDAAPDRAGGQILGLHLRAPRVELPGDGEVLGGALVHRAEDLHGGLPPAQHVRAYLAGEADESATTSSGKARARASIASKEPVATRSATSVSALVSMVILSPRSARGERFSVRVARSSVWTGGSEAREVPWRRRWRRG
ncbi:hypothetical protein NJ76_30365 [Rhodococcus sp. IITR03]|nr:hypothetical protein NJ76_30365 [Rhodococcus sp. IITR03]